MSVSNAVNRLIYILGELGYKNVLKNVSERNEDMSDLSDMSDNDDDDGDDDDDNDDDNDNDNDGSDNGEDLNETCDVDKSDPNPNPNPEHNQMLKLLKYVVLTHDNYAIYGNIFNTLLENIIMHLLEYVEDQFDTSDLNNTVHLIKSPIGAKIDEYVHKFRYRNQCENIYVDSGVGYEVNILNEHEIMLNACYTYFYWNELVVKYNVLTNQFYMMSWRYGSVNGRGGSYTSSNVNIGIEGGIDEVKNMYDIIMHDGHLDKKYISAITNYHVINDLNYVHDPKTLLDYVVNYTIRSYLGICKTHAKLSDVNGHKYMSVSTITNSIVLHVLVNRKNIYDFHLKISHGEEMWDGELIDTERTDMIVLQHIMKNGNELFSIPEQTVNISLNNITELHNFAYDKFDYSMCKFPSFCDSIVNVRNNEHVEHKDGMRITHCVFL